MSNRALRAGGMLVAAATLAVGAAITLSPGAPIPRATAEPSTPSSPTTTSAPASPAKAEFPTDRQGYLDSAARCDDGQTLLMYGRTSRSLVAVCVGPDGQLEYRGVRLSDGATLTMAASRSADGTILAVNDNVTYAISPQTLLVSEGDTVLYRDEWAQYHKAGSAAASPTPSTNAESTDGTDSTERTDSTDGTDSTGGTDSTEGTGSKPETESAPETGANTTTISTTVSTTTVTLTPSG